MKAAGRKKTNRSRPRRAPSARVKSLANLPAEFGCRGTAEFIRLFRGTVASARSRKIYQSKKIGSTVIMRNRIETSLAAGKSAMVIALELGVSMRVVDRVMSNLERRKKRKSKRVLHKRARDKKSALADLPFLYGFDSPDTLVRAVEAAARQRPASTWNHRTAILGKKAKKS